VPDSRRAETTGSAERHGASAQDRDSRAETTRALLVLDGDIRPELSRRGVILRPTSAAFPLPVREPAAVRAVCRDVALAGADVVSAMTGDLQRRALARMGAARRSAEWIREAIDLARESADQAMQAAAGAGDRPPRRIRVAGAMGPLEGSRPDLAPDAATAAAEHREHAGQLADAGVEILRIEGVPTIAESETATRAAVQSGLETWSGVALDPTGRTLASGEPLDAWRDAVAPLGAAALLLSAPTAAALEAAVSLLAAPEPGRKSVPIGAEAGIAGDDGSSGTEPVEALARRLLGTGASLLSPGPDGSPARVAALRRVVDGATTDAMARARRGAEDVEAWVQRAADRAGAGRGLWVGRVPPGVALPARFRWDVVPPTELERIPPGRCGLVVSRGAGTLDRPGLRAVVDALEPGGWTLLEQDGVESADLAADPRLEAIEPVRAAAGGGWMARRRP